MYADMRMFPTQKGRRSYEEGKTIFREIIASLNADGK